MNISPEYQATLDYIYSFVDYSLTHQDHYDPAQFNLERMRAFTRELGAPHEAYPCLHIAGTKGKGSVAALCASALQMGGYRVGLYTSPHLEDYAERIQIDGCPIPHEALVALVHELKPRLEGSRLNTFEITTGLAMLYFARQTVDIAVFEVGLGGRLDATNIVTPLAAAITSLSLDHTQFLGDTLEQIAAEKAGIIKPGIPVVLAPQKPAAREVVQQIAAERGAPLVQVGQDLHFAAGAHSLEGQALTVWKGSQETPEDQKVHLMIPLLGFHQVENAAVAYTLLDTARGSGLRLGDDDIQAGFANVHWPARLELLRREPPVLVDAAHNRDAAEKLRRALDDYFPGRPLVMIFGVSADKDVGAFIEQLGPRLKQVVATRAEHPRAMPPEVLAERVRGLGIAAAAAPTVEAALPLALELAGEEALVLATGSVFLAAAVRQVWREQTG